MTITIEMKDGTHRAYDGVYSIETYGHLDAWLWIRYYGPSSANHRAELKMNDVKSFHYGPKE